LRLPSSAGSIEDDSPLGFHHSPEGRLLPQGNDDGAFSFLKGRVMLCLSPYRFVGVEASIARVCAEVLERMARCRSNQLDN
jgi:hypothetical protein